jgi:hypothetical protein
MNEHPRNAHRVHAGMDNLGLRLCVAMAYAAIGLLLHLAPARR